MKVLPNERAPRSPRPSESQSHVPSFPLFLSPRQGVTSAPGGSAPLPTCRTISKAPRSLFPGCCCSPSPLSSGVCCSLLDPEHTPALSNGARSASQTCPLPIPGRSALQASTGATVPARDGNARGGQAPIPLLTCCRHSASADTQLLRAVWPPLSCRGLSGPFLAAA